MTSDPVADILRHAADRLEQPGVWAQGIDVLQNGRDCVASALRSPFHHDAQLRIGHVLGLRTWTAVIRWNDAPGRTAAEVVTALRHAAELQE